jgi:hypothetical protein
MILCFEGALDVQRSCPKQFGIILKETNSTITTIAQQPAKCSGLMIVIDAPSFISARAVSLTNSAAIELLSKRVLKDRLRDAVPLAPDHSTRPMHVLAHLVK